MTFIGGNLLYSRIEWIVENYSRVLREGNIYFAEHRLIASLDSLGYFLENPLLGMGFTNFFSSQENLLGFSDHNLYSILLAQGGVLVFIPFVFILALQYLNSRKILSKNMFSDPAARDMGIVLNAGLIAYIIDLNFPPGFFHYYWIWFGFAAAWTRNCEMEYRTQEKLL